MIFYLDEMFLNEDSFLRDKDNNYLITVDIGKGQEEGFLLKPYFKLYNSVKETAAPGVVRISLITAEYVDHTGKPPFNINAHVKKYIISALKKKVNVGTYTGMVVYDAIWQFIEDTGKDMKLNVASKPDMEKYFELIMRRNYSAEIK